MLNDSQWPFSHGLPGSMYSGLVPRPASHLRNLLAMNSGPLSERMCFYIIYDQLREIHTTLRVTYELLEITLTLPDGETRLQLEPCYF